jgi:transcriptional regulator
MHPAAAFQERDVGRLRAVVAQRGFALIVGAAAARPIAAHAPVLLDEASLRFHLSAANALVPVLTEAGRALVIVTGDDAYVSPDWYGIPDQVPTWNYLSVEIGGPLRRLDRDAATRLLDDLSAHFEAKLAPKRPWTREKMDAARFEAMLSGIVAFEMTVERLAGITKLSQNKPAEAIARMAGHLARSPDPGARALADLMLTPPPED